MMLERPLVEYILDSDLIKGHEMFLVIAGVVILAIIVVALAVSTKTKD